MSGPLDTPGGGDARAKLQRRQVVVGTIFAIVAVPLLYFGVGRHAESGFLALGVMAASFGGLFLWAGRTYRKTSGAVEEVNDAFAHLIAGRDEEAERRLEAMAARDGMPPYMLRAVNVQRTLLVMRRGQMDAAIGFATRSIEGNGKPAKSPWETLQVVEARALRALALASMGRDGEALADAEAAESSPMLGPSALARASLARAVILAKAGRLEELHQHYAAGGDALVEELVPRERALSRALRRMGQPRARSVYREAATHEEPADDAARDWVRKIAPDAVRFVPSAVAGPLAPGVASASTFAAPLPPATFVSSQVIARARTPGGALTKKRAAMWVALVVAFAVFRVAFSDHRGSRAGHAEASSPWSSLATTFLFSAVVVVGVVAFALRAQRRQRRRLLGIHQAQLAVVRGESPEAMATLKETAQTGGIVLGPIAYLALAQAAMRRGDVDAALEASAEGIALSSSTLQAKATLQDLHLPDLLGTRAFAFAVAGRAADASATLAALDADHPHFPFRARAFFQVELVNAIKRGDLAGAARIVAAREPEMSVDLRVDLLGEIACAAAVGGLNDEAAEALQGELHSMPRVARWIEQVAPGLSARIGREHSIRVATPYASYDDDTRPLDAEAAQLLALGARRPRS